jgi:hypothetical protein
VMREITVHQILFDFLRITSGSKRCCSIMCRFLAFAFLHRRDQALCHCISPQPSHRLTCFGPHSSASTNQVSVGQRGHLPGAVKYVASQWDDADRAVNGLIGGREKRIHV